MGAGAEGAIALFAKLVLLLLVNLHIHVTQRMSEGAHNTRPHSPSLSPPPPLSPVLLYCDAADCSSAEGMR